MIEGSVETTRIERDLEATRARLDATIGALQQKLSPGQLLDQSLAYLKDSGGSDFAHNLKQNVQTHPMPVALIGIGLAWLMMSGNGRSTVAPAMGTPSTTDDAGSWTGGYGSEALARAEQAAAGVKRTASETAEAFQERLYSAKGTALGVSRQVGEALSDFGSRVDTAMHAAARTSRATARGVGQAAGSAADAARQATHGAADAARSAAGYVQDQPLLLGAIGVSVGALLAAMLPPTRAENELMGEAGDALRERAGDVAQAALDKGVRAADEALTAGLDSARREGLTTEDARDAASDAAPRVAETAAGVRHVVENAVSAGREAIERELQPAEDEPSERARPAAVGYGTARGG